MKVRCLSHGVKAKLCPNPIQSIRFSQIVPHFHSISTPCPFPYGFPPHWRALLDTAWVKVEVLIFLKRNVKILHLSVVLQGKNQPTTTFGRTPPPGQQLSVKLGKMWSVVSQIRKFVIWVESELSQPIKVKCWVESESCQPENLSRAQPWWHQSHVSSSFLSKVIDKKTYGDPMTS